MYPSLEAAESYPALSAVEIFQKQKTAHLNHPYPSRTERADSLFKLEEMLRENQDAICEAVSQDFGHRSFHETRLLEIFPSIDGLRDCRKRLKKWMKPGKRHVSIWFAGARNTVTLQPKGVIGISVPWNYPLLLGMGPLANALAAGNRCMVKMAANSRHLCRLLAGLVRQRFDVDTLAVLPGVTAAEFTDLPYDHLVFTGSPGTGKKVMEKASRFLTPVTLELGGKSPAVIAGDFNIKTAARRIIQAKLFNAGQTCVAPDYLFLPRENLDAFIHEARLSAQKRYGNPSSKDYTAIIDEKAYTRLQDILADAREKHANIIPLFDGASSPAGTRKLAPAMILDVTEEMTLMTEEIFGPLLPVKLYQDMDEVLDYINTRQKPLALYLFSNDKALQNRVIQNTSSGGVCLNDCMMHVGQHDLPFGGIGNSGMGQYHGYEGFLELSKLRPVFKQSKMPGTALLMPPYGKIFDLVYRLMVRPHKKIETKSKEN